MFALPLGVTFQNVSEQFIIHSRFSQLFLKPFVQLKSQRFVQQWRTLPRAGRPCSS